MDPGALIGVFVAVVAVVVVGVTTVVTGVVTVGSVLLPFALLAKIASGRRAAERKLLESGVAAPARIVALSETGMYVNHQPMLRIALEVAPPEGEPFTVTVSRVCSIVQIPRLQPGALVEIRYDAADRSNAMIVGI
jgi:hypothetical protein